MASGRKSADSGRTRAGRLAKIVILLLFVVSAAGCATQPREPADKTNGMTTTTRPVTQVPDAPGPVPMTVGEVLETLLFIPVFLFLGIIHIVSGGKLGPLPNC